MRIFVTCLLIAAGLCGYAQTIIKPGDNIIRYDLVKPSHDFYKAVSMDSAGNIKQEYVNEEVITIDRAIQRITFTRSRQRPVGSFSMDTSVTDLSFRPIRLYELYPQRNVSFEMLFGDTVVSINTVRKGVLSVKNYSMKRGYFDDNMIEDIFGYLEVKKGVTYILDNFKPDNTDMASHPYEIEYAFDDVWDLAGHELYCRVLHFAITGVSSGYIWIDKDTHQMIKEVAVYKMGGAFVLTRM
jgi:hypothetical protein